MCSRSHVKENVLFVLPGGCAGARVFFRAVGQGPERDISGVQVMVRDREVVQEEDFCRQLLRRQP